MNKLLIGTNPSPFSDSPSVNVVIGLVALLVGAVSCHFADAARYTWLAYATATLGVLAVGLIHARLWRHDPWRKH